MRHRAFAVPIGVLGPIKPQTRTKRRILRRQSRVPPLARTRRDL